MKKIAFILLCISTFSQSYSQEMRSSIEYKFNTDKIKNSTTIVWYGWDYSHLIINDPNVDSKEIKSKIILYWYANLEQRNAGAKLVQKIFKNKSFSFDERTIQSLVANVPETKFVNAYAAPLEIDSIKSIVKQYNVTGEGLGVVAIANQMKKADISVTAFVVIFDIKTKEILYAIKTKSKAGDKGSFARFYLKGIAETMVLFRKSCKSNHFNK